MTRGPGRFALASDLRFDVFAVLFGIGTIHHEIGFLREQSVVGPFWEYMERWGRAVPSIGWGSETGLALHLATAGIGLLAVALPRRRELLCLLAPVFLLSQLASPARIGSHNGLMAGGLLVVLLLGAGEWLARAGGGRRAGVPRTEWYRWTLTGLAWVCALTYFFAFFYKLNPVWFSDQSAAPRFLVDPLAPFLKAFGLTGGQRLLGAFAIWGTLLVELTLPLLLFCPRTRLLACLIGLGFHLPMIVGSVSDFPTLIVAFYPAFLSLAETEALVRRCRARPSPRRLVAIVALGGLGTWAILRSRKLWWIHAGGAGSWPVIPIIDAVATWATFVALTHVILVLAAWLLERPARDAVSTPIPAGEVPPAAEDAHRHMGPALRGPVMALATVLLVGAAFVYNNVGPFFGLPAAGAMSMFSGISPDRGNHFLMLRTAVIDPFTYVRVVSFETRDVVTREIRDFHAFVRWVEAQKNSPHVQLNLVRYQMDRICRSAPTGTVSVTLRTTDGTIQQFADVCAVPAMRRYWVIQNGGRCSPPCNQVFRLWAQGKLASD